MLHAALLTIVMLGQVTEQDKIAFQTVNQIQFVSNEDLTDFKTATTTEQLIPFLYHENFHLRYFACRNLGHLGDPKSVTHLINKTEDPVASVRGNACEALGNFKNETAVNHLVHCLSDPTHRVRVGACKGLIQMGQNASSATSILKYLTQNKHYTNRAYAAGAYYAVSGDEKLAVLVLIELIQHKSTQIEACEVFQLTDIGTMELLRLRSDDPETQYFIKRAMK